MITKDNDEKMFTIYLSLQGMGLCDMYAGVGNCKLC